MVSLADDKFADPGTDAAVAAYAYDALGRRIEFRNHYDGSGIYGSGPTEVTTRYVYDGQNVIEEYNTNGDRQRYYVHGTGYIDERAVMHDDDEPGGGSDAADYYYLLKDLYTVVGLAQANGHEVERYIYDAYGKATVVSVLAADVNFDGSVDSLDQGVIRSPSRWLQSGCDAGTVYDINMDGDIDSLDLGAIRNPANWMQSNTELSASALGNPYFFTGRRRDAYLDAPVGTNGVKQIQYNRARYYDLDNGRWLQRDPIGYKDGMNLYEYAKSNPLTNTDPSGLRVRFWGYIATAGADRGTIGMTIHVDIWPPPCCRLVRFAQLVREQKWRIFYSDTGWVKDAPLWRHWYPNVEGPDALPRGGQRWTLEDYPGKLGIGGWGLQQFQQDFETCALCVFGSGRGTRSCILGCVTWGHLWIKGKRDTHIWWGPTGSGLPSPQMTTYLRGTYFRSTRKCRGA